MIKSNRRFHIFIEMQLTTKFLEPNGFDVWAYYNW
jgi:hypothetical protein